MKLIVGLGNPGKEYENTRHNVGFMIIDYICENEKFSKKFNGLFCEKRINGEKVIFLKPQSYMNLSGIVVKAFQKFYKIEYKDILIIHDDLDLKLGSAKIKVSSSSGGDNGVKSIINELGTKDFVQYKVGISNNKDIQTKDYVLGKFNSNEKEILTKKIKESKEIINYYIENNAEKTMSYFNGKIK